MSPWPAVSAFCPGEMPVQSETSAGVPVSRGVPSALGAPVGW